MARPKRGADGRSRAAEPSGVGGESSWTPDIDLTRRIDYVAVLLDQDDRYHVRMDFDARGQLVDFSLAQQRRVVKDGTGNSEDWVDVIRVDCCHGEVHAHRSTRSGKRTRRKWCKIEGPDDVNAGWEYANRAVLDQWPQNLRRWEHG